MATGFETPGQRPPTLKNAAALTDSHEYAAIWTGQSNSRPWGFPEDGYQFAAELNLTPTGVDLATVVIPDNSDREIGIVEWLAVDATVALNQWATSTYLRLGTTTAPLAGYAQVLSNIAASIQVRWISLPANNATVAGYLVRENGKFSNYEHVRVLTPYTPLRDIQEAVANAASPFWAAPAKAPYPTANAAISAGGKRLTLPAPHTLPAAVTSFSDLGVFLPLTRREGSDGYGISEIADATFTGTGTPTGHPVTTIVGQVFSFENAISATADLTNGYLIVDWESGGATKRSWARLASNTTTTFTTDTASWLGDGVPATPSTATITVDIATDEVIWTSHGLLEGDRFFLTTTDTAPGGLTAGRVYTVVNVNGFDRFQVAASLDHPVIDITDVGVGTHTGWRAWSYTAWIPYWKDNPYTWLPGPEFAYPNEDMQPRGTYVHFRARGQVLYVHSGGTTPEDGSVGGRFGALLPFAWRMGAALGKRMNVVALGINSTPMITGNLPNFAVYPGVVGWWDYEQYGFSLALESATSSLATRLKRLINFIAPNALVAEANTKTLRYLAAAHVQGEADALFDAGHELYTGLITDFKEWLRDAVETGGFSPYANGARMPFVQPLITYYPWEADITQVTIVSSGSGSSSAEAPATDINGEVNNGVREAHTSEEFADYVETDDLPKLIYASGAVDESHFAGQGMAVMGSRLAGRALDLVEHAMSYGSPALSTPLNTRLVDIANMALRFTGQTVNPITDLTANTTEARLVSAMLPNAVKQLLTMGRWTWARRAEPATMVLSDDPEWDYAYVVPGRAISPIAITPPQDASSTTTNFVSVIAPIHQGVPILPKKPEKFVIKQSPSGHRLLLTNVPQNSADLSQPYFADGKLHPERLPGRPWIHYTAKVVDAERYSHNFAMALSWLLASMLAHALIRGKNADEKARDCYRTMAGYLNAEADHETVSQHEEPEHIAPWMAAR